MSKVIVGTYKCEEDGIFTWGGCLPDESVSAEIGERMRNCSSIEKAKDKYVITVVCPECGKSYCIERNIKKY